MLKAKLVVVGGDAKAKEVALRLPTVIGRGKDVSLTLPHPLVSRRHTEIFEKDGCLYVKDLGSLNGTYVNNRRIKEEQKLPPNHLLTLGNVTFRAVYEADEPVVHAGPDQPTQQDDDETVNFEELEKPSTNEDDAVAASEDQSQEPTAEATPQEVAAEEELAGSVAAAKVSKTKPVEKEEAKSEPVAADDLNSHSSIFSGDEDFVSAEKSICVNALEGLPSQASASSISFTGNGLLGDEAAAKSMVDSIDLDIGDAKPGDSSKSDPDLGSFLKKLPR